MPASQPKTVGRMPGPAKKTFAAPKIDTPAPSEDFGNDSSNSSEDAPPPPVPVRAMPKRGAAAPTRTPQGTLRAPAPARAAPKFTPQASEDEPATESYDMNPDEDNGSSAGSRRNSPRGAPPVPKKRPSMSAPKTNGPPAARRFSAPRKA
jgi:hypothetical protein